ncbi:MAG TPA: hypothetical protein VKG45_14090 [Actinomycetes bacterium]|nr:hypothetical protein [Actinomycetes bacterium]
MKRAAPSRWPLVVPILGRLAGVMLLRTAALVDRMRTMAGFWLTSTSRDCGWSR